MPESLATLFARRCHLPENLVGCETCCRSYRAQCLLSAVNPRVFDNFHSSSCRENGWDRAPPRSPVSSSASNSSRDATLSGGSFQRNESHRFLLEKMVALQEEFLRFRLRTFKSKYISIPDCHRGNPLFPVYRISRLS